MTDTIKHINETLNESALARIRFGDYVANGKQLLFVEKLSGGDETTHRADCCSEEVAQFLAEAANEWANQSEIIRNSSLDDDLKQSMLQASGLSEQG